MSVNVRSPLVAVTMGDPSGIGPEIAVKALADSTLNSHGCRFVIIGVPSVIKEAVSFLNLDIKVKVVDKVEDGDNSCRVLYVYPVDNTFDREANPFGQITHDCGRISLMAVRTAAEFVTQQLVTACATAPISKEAFHLAGAEGAGHAEIFKKAASVDKIATMLCHDTFRVVHLTTHLSLIEACRAVKKQRIIDVVSMTEKAMKQLGFEKPAIAVAALNPHGGDGGLFGTEEAEEILPAVNSLRSSGFNVSGPIPADIVFSQARGGMWDVVIALYHDQGHIPIKVASFEYDSSTMRWISTGGVTLTLGLPFARTSVDHGTAFDIAGKGIADHGAMKSAVEFAAGLAVRAQKIAG